jgi:hypothetical protein
MASLHEYFVKDGASNLTIHESWDIKDVDGSCIVRAVARLHLDFEARAKFVSFFIPYTDKVSCPEAMLLNNLEQVLNLARREISIQKGFGAEVMQADDLVFTGRVYLYAERPLDRQLRDRLIAESKPKGHNLVFRSTDYATERSKWEKPRAFISHDSRDKAEIAEPLAIELQKLMCPVWFDSFSLNVGDSLRESIETGLKECTKCIFILTPNFLRNGGWSKREYDSIFTRELVEKQKVILPVWHNVTPEQVYEYSPILADRLAVQWTDQIQDVARKLLRAIDS